MSLWPPESFETAIDRLPLDTHPLYSNPSIRHLADCREQILYYTIHPEEGTLEERVLDLTREHFKLMEQTSFYKDKERSLFFPWASVSRNSIWGEAIESSLTNDYTNWKISLAKPHTTFSSQGLLFIEANTREYHRSGGPTDEEIYYIAIVDNNEILSLIEELSKGQGHTEGEIEDFLY